MLQEIFADTERKMQSTARTFSGDLKKIRTGRASVSLLDGVRVDYYGTLTPLNQMAALSTPQSNLIVIQPWDMSIIAEVEKAIMKSDLGVTPTNDGKVIRLAIPPLTEERRKDLVKLVKKQGEEAKVSTRNVRREGNDRIKKALKDKEVSEDAAHKGYDRIQELTNSSIKQIDELVAEKEKEIFTF